MIGTARADAQGAARARQEQAADDVPLQVPCCTQPIQPASAWAVAVRRCPVHRAAAIISVAINSAKAALSTLRIVP